MGDLTTSRTRGVGEVGGGRCGFGGGVVWVWCGGVWAMWGRGAGVVYAWLGQDTHFVSRNANEIAIVC